MEKLKYMILKVEDKMTIYQLKPIYDQTVWGNNYLTSTRGVRGENYGTSWEISFHNYGSNKVLDSNKELKDMLTEDRDNLVGNQSDKELLRYAYLDTISELSVQVHPTMEYAEKNLDDYGKYEAWYIIKAEPDATLVAGCETNDMKEIEKAIKNNTLEELLIYHSVKTGDFIYIPAGGIHALGAGILAIEISTNSNTTYRVYDYGRTDDSGNTRELHLEEALATMNLVIRPEVGHLPNPTNNISELTEFVNNEYFIWSCLDLVENFAIEDNSKPLYLTILDEDIVVKSGNQVVKTAEYEHLFISADTSTISFNGTGRILIGEAR